MANVLTDGMDDRPQPPREAEGRDEQGAQRLRADTLPDAGAPADPHVGAVGMWIFLATELLFFGGLFLAYAVARGQWPQGFAAAGVRTHVVIGTVNTALLLTGSALVAGAAEDARAGGIGRWTSRLLASAAALGLAFLVLKGVEYAKEAGEHLVPGPGFALQDHPGAALFYVLYYVTTALHGLHVLIGVGTLAVFAWGTARRAPWATPRRVEIAGLYWHFVDIVWILLYPLLYLVGRNT
jgi:cytochrome c oxidase subunit 3